MRKPQARPKLTTARFAERYEAAATLQQRRYCDAFARWRDCAHKPCRRARACRGDAPACLRRAITALPWDLQHRVRQDIVKAMPARLGGPERAAWTCSALDFFDGSADRYAIQEMKRLLKAGKIVQRGDNVDSLRLWLIDSRR